MCHQTVGLVTRHLEANGLPTVVFGCARDIVEHCGVPRFVFSDFPLGNPCGKPFEPAMQRAIVELGLDLLERAVAPGTTVVAPYEWDPDTSWKDKVFTAAQPFLDEAATARWLRRKESHREASRPLSSQASARRSILSSPPVVAGRSTRSTTRPGSTAARYT